MNINLRLRDWDLVVKCLDHRLFDMDQEHNFFNEEPSKEYYQLIEIRDYILAFTEPGNRVESKDHAG